MRRPSAIFLACAVLPFLAGCFLSRRTVNERLQPDTLAGFEAGRTTAKEVVERLGAPSEVVQLYKRSAYRYEAPTTKYTGLWLILVGLYNTDEHADRAWFFFDENEVLTHVGATLAADDAEYALPWEKVSGR